MSKRIHLATLSAVVAAAVLAPGAASAATIPSASSSVLQQMGQQDALLAPAATGNIVSNADLLSYQAALAANSLGATFTSAIAKERADTLTAISQKF